MKERRRTPRIDVLSVEVVRLELRRQVRLLDISQSGALLSCEPGLPSGGRGHLRTELASLPFQAEVSVKRHEGRSAPRGEVALGAEFISIDERSRQHLVQFLRGSTE